MQVVFAAVVVSFVGFYGTRPNDTTGVVATVNGQKIMGTEFSRVYQGALRQKQAYEGRSLTNAEEKALQEDVKQGMIEQEVLLQEALHMGLEVSDSEVAAIIFENFQDEDGKYDEEVFQRSLKRSQLSQDSYVAMQRKAITREKLRSIVLMGASISEPALQAAFVEENTRVDLTTVRIRPSNFNDDVVITDEERAAWLIEYEELVKQSYKRDFERLYKHPEKATLRMIRLGVLNDGLGVADLLPKMNQIREEVEAGADFAELAKKWSEDPSAMRNGDLGERAVAQLSKDVADAISGLEIGSVTRVIPGDNDVRLYKLEARTEPFEDALEDVRNDIADRLIREERVPGLAATFAEDALLGEWTSAGEPPTELLTSKRLFARPTGEISVKSDGSPFSPPAAMLQQARKAEPGTVFPEVFEVDGTLWVAQLTARTDADLDLYASQRDEIRESVLWQRRQEFFTAWVADLIARATIQ
jgi:parvulin-like peptidyl-prolyl isomerase